MDKVFRAEECNWNMRVCMRVHFDHDSALAIYMHVSNYLEMTKS